jgi:hypothetical protein
MTNAKMIMGIIMFQFFFAFLVADATGTTFMLLSPLTLSALSILLAAVIAASNTPIIKGGAMLLFFGAVVALFAFSPTIPTFIFGLVLVPIWIGLGMSMADVGRG